MTELLGKLMAHVLSIFALSIKEMKEGRISELIRLMWPFLTDWRRKIPEETCRNDEC
jgi:hypothetical protein